MQKNDIIELEITAITGAGDGIGHSESGITVFVPNTAVGDVCSIKLIKVKKNYCIGKLLEIIRPSGSRIDSDCDISNRCGGCVFRHISYNEELKIKFRQVYDSFLRIGKLNVIPDEIRYGNTDFYRNKAQLPVGIDKDGKIVCGYYTKSSHRIVPCKNCKLSPAVFNEIIKIFCDFCDEFSLTVYDEKSSNGLLRHLYLRRGEVSGQIMVCVVINGDKLPFCEVLIERLKEYLGDCFVSFVININKDNTNVVLGNKCKTLYGQGYILDELCGVKLKISPLSFYQVNHNMTEVLYGIAKDFAEPHGKTLLDLYCGIGSIGLTMAKEAKKIIGVEVVQDAVNNAEENACLNGFDNTRYICSTAKDAAIELNKEGIKPDVVILDPPRKGCDTSVISTVANEFSPERIVYISCNDSTLARDCAIFSEYGYSVKKAVPVDLFPRTGHVETVVLMLKVK